MTKTDAISFAGFMASRVTALYREALLLTGSAQRAEAVLEETLIRTGLQWREAMLSDPESFARAVMTQLASTGPSTLEDPGEIAALADAPTTQAPRDIADRVGLGIAMRRRRSRDRGLAIAAGLVLVILAAFGASAVSDSGTADSGTADFGTAAEGGPPPSARSSRTHVPAPNASAAPQSLDRVVDRSRATRLPVAVAEGLYFRAEALGPNGIILGGTGLDFGPYLATDGLVWALGPGAGRRVTLTRPPPRLPWAHAIGVTVAAWAEDSGDRFELFCADPNAATPVARQVSTTGVATSEGPIHADGDVVVWLDESLVVQWVRGCGGTPTPAAVPNVFGLSYPEVFYAEGGRLRAFNLESGQSSEVGILDDAPERVRLAFAGNSTHVAWALDGVLSVLDRRDGALRRVTLPGLPPLGGYGRVTIGWRLVAYAQQFYASELEYGFVLDVDSGLGVTIPTMTYASRDRLMWREDTSYVVATVLPA